jgi:predicted amidohydrolase YtcJ
MVCAAPTIFTNARIVTLWEALPEVDAVSVVSGRIMHMGTLEEVRLACGNTAKEVDCGGGTLYPGFIDTHSHLSLYAGCISHVRCGAELGSVASVLEALRRWGDDHPEADWIIGYGYDDSGIGDKRHLARNDLDAVSRDRPVFVKHMSLHLGYANTPALERLGIGRDSAVRGGEIYRDDAGTPTGVLAENAAFAAFAGLPSLGPGQFASNLRKAMAHYNAQGFTTIMDGGVDLDGAPDRVMNAYMSLARSQELTARIYLQFLPDIAERLASLGLWEWGDEHLAFGGVKCFADGSIQAYTAALEEEYFGRPGWRGELVLEPDELERIVSRYHRLGVQVAIHVNGDRAVETALLAFEKAAAEWGRKGSSPLAPVERSTGPVPPLAPCKAPHMLVHAQLATPAQIQRMRDCGVFPTFFARHVTVFGERHRAIYLGPERAARLDPVGVCLRLGMPFGLHVDTPVLPPTALGSMYSAVTRRTDAGNLLGEEFAIGPLDALRAYTVHAARCCGGERDRGCLRPGLLGDFVVLSHDLEREDPLRWDEIKVYMTVCGGNIVFGA